MRQGMKGLFVVLVALTIGGLGQALRDTSEETPSPKPWPLQFHALLFINASSSDLQAVDLWYDWPKGRNFNIIQHQLSNVIHDLEWTNGTSFYYDLDRGSCKTIHFDVGILTPDWLHGATYLGVQSLDGFRCNVWSKADFITYWEDIVTQRPVYWLFYTGMSAHVMTFEEGAVLEDSQWQAPVYCFTGQNQQYTETADSNINRSPKENNPWLRWFQGLEKTAFRGLSLV